MKISNLKKISFFFLLIIVVSCIFTSCCKDEECTDCVNYSGCLDESNETGREIHDLLGKLVMEYDECLLNNIPESIDNIRGDFAPISNLTNPNDDFMRIEDCKIPFYAPITFEPDTVSSTEMQDSIKTNILLTFNKKYDNVEFKVLAIDWTANGDLKKFNETSIDFYVKPDATTTYSVNCKIYSTDFKNVYVKSFNSCFEVGKFNNVYRPDISCGNYTNISNLACACVELGLNCGYGTIAIILPNPD